jgi:hypothetical protein
MEARNEVTFLVRTCSFILIPLYEGLRLLQSARQEKVAERFTAELYDTSA